jgi:hypothetical protein
MGYLCNRGYLRDLEELAEVLPVGWTYNTPTEIKTEELEMFCEVSPQNLLFRRMVEGNLSINQVLNGRGFKDPQGVEVEQQNAATAWANHLYAELNYYRHHPLDTGAYVHTMWARQAGRTEASQAIFIIDCSDYSSEYKDRFYEEVRSLERKEREIKEPLKTPPQGGGTKNNGVSRNITTSSGGYWWSVGDKRWCRGTNHGHKSRGKSIADKRRAEMRDLARKSKAVWV